MGFILGMQGCYNICKSINVIHYKIKMRDNKLHDYINRSRKKIFDKNPTPSFDKTLSKVSIVGTYLYIIKAIYDKPTANIILKGQKIQGFPLRLAT